MPLSIKDPETERLARDLAQPTGETITVATKKALGERLRPSVESARKLCSWKSSRRSGGVALRSRF